MPDKKTADPQASHNISTSNPSTNAARHGDLPVLDLQKNSRERLRITRTTFKGNPYVDLRVWYVDEAGDYQPSRSGVSIRPDHLAEVMRGLGLAARAIDPKEAA
jgi:hypothetical protein